MRNPGIVRGALLLSSVMLLAFSPGSMAAVGADAEEPVEIKYVLEEANLGAATASTSVNTTMLWWGLPFTWWPPKFCYWDHWTTAAWQLTLYGNGAQCSAATGNLLATYARQAVISNPNIRGWLLGRVGSVTTSYVLCARSGNTLRYTIRLVAPRNIISALRQSPAQNIMNGIFTQSTLQSRTFSGLKGLLFVNAIWIKEIQCNQGCLSRPAASLIQTGTGTFNCTPPVAINATCSYRCATGTVPRNNTAPICRQGGVWGNNSGGAPACVQCNVARDCADGGACVNNTCQAPGCTSPPDASLIQNGTGIFNCTTPVTIGATCSYTCADGTVPRSDTNPICGQGGDWELNSVGAPACVQCNDAGDCAGGAACEDFTCQASADRQCGGIKQDSLLQSIVDGQNNITVVLNTASVPTGATGIVCGLTTNQTVAESWNASWTNFFATNSSPDCTSDACLNEQTVMTTVVPLPAEDPYVFNFIVRAAPDTAFAGVDPGTQGWFMCGAPYNTSGSFDGSQCAVDGAPPDGQGSPPEVFGPFVIEPICFPSDAQLRRVNKATGVLESVAIETLAIGDQLECLKPSDAGDGTISGFAPGLCDVYYYVNAKEKPAMFQYVHLSYTKADGSEGLFRASPRHGIITPTASIPPSNPQPVPGPGVLKSMENVQVGDLIAVSTGTGGYYTSPVTAITRKYNAGAYSPLLTDAGMFIVDGVMAFYSSAGSVAASPNGQAKGWSSHYAKAPVWQQYLIGNSSNCIQNGNCPCLDRGNPCVKQGDTLASMPDDQASWYMAQSQKVTETAKAAGRTKQDNIALVAAVKAGLSMGKIFTFEEGLALVDASYKAP